MCYNTISHYCYEVPDLNCGKRTDTIGIHHKYLERPCCNAAMILGLMGYF